MRENDIEYSIFLNKIYSFMDNIKYIVYLINKNVACENVIIHTNFNKKDIESEMDSIILNQTFNNYLLLLNILCSKDTKNYVYCLQKFENDIKKENKLLKRHHIRRLHKLNYYIGVLFFEYYQVLLNFVRIKYKYYYCIKHHKFCLISEANFEKTCLEHQSGYLNKMTNKFDNYLNMYFYNWTDNIFKEFYKLKVGVFHKSIFKLYLFISRQTDFEYLSLLCNSYDFLYIHANESNESLFVNKIKNIFHRWCETCLDIPFPEEIQKVRFLDEFEIIIGDLYVIFNYYLLKYKPNEYSKIYSDLFSSNFISDPHFQYNYILLPITE